jgi:hypothetical protein
MADDRGCLSGCPVSLCRPRRRAYALKSAPRFPSPKPPRHHEDGYVRKSDCDCSRVTAEQPLHGGMSGGRRCGCQLAGTKPRPSTIVSYPNKLIRSSGTAVVGFAKPLASPQSRRRRTSTRRHSCDHIAPRTPESVDKNKPKPPQIAAFVFAELTLLQITL